MSDTGEVGAQRTSEESLKRANRPLDLTPPEGICVGRVHVPAGRSRDGIGGPTVVAVGRDGVRDLSPSPSTMTALLELPNALETALGGGEIICSLDEAMANSTVTVRDDSLVHFLAPIDLQVIKACGVTFPASVIERLVEERARGEAGDSSTIRQDLDVVIADLRRGLVPGSPEAAVVKARLIEANLWSQYLEVAIGPYAEVFTKAPVLSSVGTGELMGVRDDSEWSNPEAEIVLVMNSRNEILGATLGNDLNLRDFEGRSALLLGVAKDNTGSCAVGPWIRLFQSGSGGFGLPELMRSDLSLCIDGVDGYSYSASGSLRELARDPADLAAQVVQHHQYPDGYVLFLGTPFAPTDDRAEVGRGFTHRTGDRVSIQNEYLGTLTNWVGNTGDVSPWTMGIQALYENLARRELIAR